MLGHRTAGMTECIVRPVAVAAVAVVVEAAAIAAAAVGTAAAGDVDVAGLAAAVVRIPKSNRKTRLPDRYR